MKNIIAVLLSVGLIISPTIAHADEENAIPDLRITELAQGQRAPFAGILLTPDSLTKIENDAKLKISLLENNHRFDLQKLQLQIDAEKALRLSQQQMHEEIFQSQIRRIESLEQIAINKKPDWVLPVAILTSFIVGAGVTVGITYAVNQ